MASKHYPGYHQINLDVARSVDLTHVFEEIKLPRIILKALPHVYCTKKTKDGGIHHPDADVKIVADLWIMKGLAQSSAQRRRSAISRSINLEAKYRCEAHVDRGVFTDKNGEVIEVENAPEVINAIYKSVFGEVK